MCTRTLPHRHRRTRRLAALALLFALLAAACGSTDSDSTDAATPTTTTAAAPSADSDAAEDTADDQSDARVDIVRGIYDSINAQDPSGFDVIAENFVENTPGVGFPTSGDDRADLIERVVGFGHAAPDFFVDNQHIFVAGDHVGVFSLASGTLEQDFFNFPGNGNEFKFGAIDVWEFNDDNEIVGIWHQEDFLAFSAQVGGQLPANAVTGTGDLQISTGGDASDADLALVDRFYRSVEQADFESLTEIVRGDLVEWTPNPTAPTSGNARDDLFGRVTSLAGSSEDFTIDNRGVFITDSFAIVASTVTGVQTGDLLGIPNSGNPFEFRAIDILRYEDGQITQLWHYEDLLGLNFQLNPPPAPGGDENAAPAYAFDDLPEGPLFLMSLLTLDGDARAVSTEIRDNLTADVEEHGGTWFLDPITTGEELVNDALPDTAVDHPGDVTIIAEFPNGAALTSYLNDPDRAATLAEFAPQIDDAIRYIAEARAPFSVPLPPQPRLDQIELRPAPAFILLNGLSIVPEREGDMLAFLAVALGELNTVGTQFTEFFTSVAPVDGEIPFESLVMTEWPSEDVFFAVHNDPEFVAGAEAQRNGALALLTENRGELPIHE